MKILVTGGAGFIGSFLVDKLVRKNHQVIVFDNLDKQVHPTGEEPIYLNKKTRFIRGDIRNYSELKKAIADNEIVFHFAAKVGVGQSQYQIKEYIDVNIGGTANLLDILVNEKHKVKKLIVAGSMSSYGEDLCKCNKCGEIRPELLTEEQMSSKEWELKCPVCKSYLSPIPTPESVSLNCNSIYALTKKVQEEISLIIGKTYSIPTVVLRFFNVYGPRRSLSNPYTGVAAIFMGRIKNNQPPIIFEDGLQTRDFVYVTNVVRACILAMERPEANANIFNFGSGSPVSILSIAQVISRIYEKNIQPKITNRFRKGDVRHCFADISKIKRKLGFMPIVNFYQGMKELISWARTVPAIDKYDSAQKELEQKGLVL